MRDIVKDKANVCTSPQHFMIVTMVNKTFMVKDGSVINFSCTLKDWKTCGEVATELQSQQCHCSRREKYTLQKFTKLLHTKCTDLQALWGFCLVATLWSIANPVLVITYKFAASCTF